MHNKILENEVQTFIKSFKGDISELLLGKQVFEALSNKELAVQIQSYQLAKKKIPVITDRNDIIYPPKIHLEQSSSQLTAQFKSNLLDQGRGVDLTGGFGIDTYYLAQSNRNVIYTDTNQKLTTIVDHNFKRLELNNVQVYDLPADTMLDQLPMQLDWFFIDPSRRNDQNAKLITLENCKPDILKLQNKLKAKFHTGLIKASPMLSIDKAVQQLDQVEVIHVIGIKNEVKELLFQVNYTKEVKEIKVKCYDLNNPSPLIYQNNYGKENRSKMTYSAIKKYLYLPHPAIAKAQLFNVMAEDYQVGKIAESTHIYTSNVKLAFPGRKFRVQEVLKYKPKKLKKLFSGKDYHLITKNFGIKSDVISSAWALQPKGNKHLIAFKDRYDRRLIAETELIASGKEL